MLSPQLTLKNVIKLNSLIASTLGCSLVWLKAKNFNSKHALPRLDAKVTSWKPLQLKSKISPSNTIPLLLLWKLLIKRWTTDLLQTSRKLMPSNKQEMLSSRRTSKRPLLKTQQSWDAEENVSTMKSPLVHTQVKSSWSAAMMELSELTSLPLTPPPLSKTFMETLKTYLRKMSKPLRNPSKLSNELK